MSSQFASILRTILKLAGAALVTHGVIDEGSVEPIIGGLLAVAGIAWSHFEHKTA